MLSGLALAGVPEEEVLAELRALVFRIHGRLAGGKPVRWMEKSGFDIFYLDEIERLLAGHCRFLCVVRHPLDVVASVKDLVDKAAHYMPELREHLPPGWSRFLSVAATRGEAPAFIEDRGVTTFAALRSLAGGWAEHAGAGIGPGDRVIVWSANSVAMAAAILGIWSRGAIPVPLGAQTPLRHLIHAASVTDAVLIAAEPARANEARKATGRPVTALEAGDGLVDVSVRGANGEAAASILFTSGSTGLPKGVVQSPRSLQAGCDAVALSLGLTAEHRILCGVPWAFDYGWGQLLSTFFRGIAQVMPAAPDPIAICEAIGRHCPSVLAAIPPLLAGLTQGVSGIERTDLSSIRMVTNTGSRIAPAVFRDVLHWFPH